MHPHAKEKEDPREQIPSKTNSSNNSEKEEPETLKSTKVIQQDKSRAPLHLHNIFRR
jgi:hypothetical protein